MGDERAIFVRSQTKSYGYCFLQDFKGADRGYFSVMSIFRLADPIPFYFLLCLQGQPIHNGRQIFSIFFESEKGLRKFIDPFLSIRLKSFSR